jgi:RimJ/RimL family protein N-acetyltransferase
MASGRGCGKRLLAAALDQADRWLNLRRLELNVWADNAAAIALYEQFGFEREGLYRALRGVTAPMRTRSPWRGSGCERAGLAATGSHVISRCNLPSPLRLSGR